MANFLSSQQLETKGKVLIVGCGALGIQTAGLLQADNYEVVGARRVIQSLPKTIVALSIDITEPASLTVLSEQQWDAVIITLTADSFTADAYRRTYIEGLHNVLQSLSRRLSDQAISPLVLFASSTSVYGQADGSSVDECSVTVPTSFSGQTMLAAEGLIEQYPGPACSIRFGGIYGRGKSRLVSRLEAGEICPHEPVIISNRIHSVDCCRIFVHLLRRYQSGKALDSIYLAVDSQPTPLYEVMQWLANKNRIPLTSLKQGAVIARGSNKRCLNQRLLNSGFSLQYPSFKEGFSDR